MDEKVFLIGIVSELSRQTRMMAKYFEIKGVSKDYIDAINEECNQELVDTLKKATGIDPDELLRKVVGGVE